MSRQEPTQPGTIPAAGTQIVTLRDLPSGGSEPRHPRGAVGVIVKSPTDHLHAFLVRFPDGHEAAMKRHEFAVRKHHQREGLEGPAALDGFDLRDCVIYRCVVGSRAYGLETEASDTDRRGVYLPPASMHWSLHGVPEQLESHEQQECYWELQKFLTLALKANPNVLECLYTPLVEHATEFARELLDMREVFLSRLVYQTYNGYVMSQFKKLGTSLRTRGRIKWKHAMHLVRLQLAGITVMKEGRVPVRVDEHRDRLLAIRDGLVPWEDVDRWRLELHRAFDAAYAATRLPERPDYGRVNAFLVKARRAMATAEDSEERG